MNIEDTLGEDNDLQYDSNKEDDLLRDELFVGSRKNQEKESEPKESTYTMYK